MATTSVHVKVIRKMIAMLAAVSDVTSYVPAANIYGSHIATIKDAAYPCISLMIGPGAGANPNLLAMIRMNVQMDLWFQSVAGPGGSVWDDVFTCYQAALNAFHQVGAFDSSIGVKIVRILNVSEGPKMFENDTQIMHWPSRFSVMATL